MAAEKDTEIDAIFQQIIATRPASEWNGIETQRAAQLAMLMHMVNNDTALLVRAGSLIKTNKGAKPNPLLYSLDKQNGQINHLCRSLGLTIHTNGKGDPRDQMGKNAQFERDHGRGMVGQSGGAVISLAAILSDDN